LSVLVFIKNKNIGDPVLTTTNTNQRKDVKSEVLAQRKHACEVIRLRVTARGLAEHLGADVQVIRNRLNPNRSSFSIDFLIDIAAFSPDIRNMTLGELFGSLKDTAHSESEA